MNGAEVIVLAYTTVHANFCRSSTRESVLTMSISLNKYHKLRGKISAERLDKEGFSGR